MVGYFDVLLVRYIYICICVCIFGRCEMIADSVLVLTEEISSSGRSVYTLAVYSCKQKWTFY